MKYCDQCRSTYPAEFTTCPKDQAVLRGVTEFVPGMILRGKYEIREKIGAGGMAAVYRVRHLHLNEDVAIKVVSGALAEDAGFVDRFKTEAIITRKLRHPNAVRLDDFDTTDDGRPFIVMEYVRGQSLREVLQHDGWLPAPRAASIARQAALALGAAHQLGIVHRDVKPENILLIPQPDGTDLVKVLDFGIAKVREGAFDVGPGYTPTRTGIVLGTPQYLSPEQARGGSSEVDARADLYALGVVLYEMLAGSVPFSAPAPFDLLLHHIQTLPPPLQMANPGINVSTAMSELVMTALEKDPGRRFQTGEAMAEALADPEVSAQGEATAHAFNTGALAAAMASESSQSAGRGPAAHMPAPAAGPPASRGDTLPIPAPALPHAGTRRLTAVTAPRISRSKPRRSGKWILIGGVAVAGLSYGLWLLLPFRPLTPAGRPAAIVAAPAASTAAKNTSRPAATPRRVSPPAPAPRRSSPDAVDQARATQLVALGYRRLEQRDFAGARDAFEQALEIDPDNAAARKGLGAATTGQTVQGVADIFRR